MQAPNGQPTHLSEKQWLQTRTEAFKEWAGDWLNDPENAGVVLDDNGEPKILYCGSRNPNSYVLRSLYDSGALFFTDNPDVARVYATKAAKSKGQKLTEEEIQARVQPVFLTMPKRAEFDAQGRHWEEATEEPVYVITDSETGKAEYFRTREEAEQYCEANGLDPEIEIEESRATGDVADHELMDGNDGVVFHNVIDGAQTVGNVYVVKESGQAKSATQNNGEFYRSNPDIRFQIEDGEPVTDPDPHEISEKARQRMEKKAEKVRNLNANMNTKPAERLSGMAKIIYENQDNTWGIMI